MSTVNLDTLPEALIFEICNELEIFDLVSLSEVNQNLRTLANTRVSFWLQTLSETNLILPLARSLAFQAYDAKDLNIAAHRAVMIERNLTADVPRLRSWRHIEWPFEPTEDLQEEDMAMWESPTEAVSMHLVDDEVTDDLAPYSQIREQITTPGYRLDPHGKFEDDFCGTKQLKAAKQFEIPISLAGRKYPVYLFLIVEWCGTAIVQLKTGELWVLRYGKA
ncbi:hypothetical protein FRB91_003827 [Serendipita sp. 411]|nr:hypothetical protein FRB91_003827 [Serendipita sp. 411]